MIMSRKFVQAFVVLIGLALVLFNGCQAQLISREEEIRLGQEASAQFEREHGGRLTTGRAAAIVQKIGPRIARVASSGEFYPYPYEFRVLNTREVNANAFPGGIIYLWLGLFEALHYDEEQLAWVAGHEAAHVAKRHAVRRIEQQLGYSLVIQLLLGKGDVAKIAAAVSALTLQAYSRDQELQADALGARFAYEAGYDPTAALAVLETFKRLQGREPSDLEIFFASHPGNTLREDKLKTYFREQGWKGRYFTP